MAKTLTVAACNKIKPDPAKRLEIPDGLLTGLYFVVQPTGRKSWAVRYRAQGKPRKLVLGNYPTIELGDARSEAQKILRSVQKGEDPGTAKQNAKRQGGVADRKSFDSVTRLFLARYAKPKNRSWKETARQLGLKPASQKLTADATTVPSASDDLKSFVAIRGGIVDKWGHRPITEITRAEVIALLDDIVDRGAPVAANRTLAALRKLFNWAIERDILETSPTDRVKPPAAEKSRDRVLSDRELKALWHASEALGWPFGPMVQLLILTGQRREEVASMAWSEIDVDRAEWVLPRGRVKNDKEHTVPLSAAALTILHQVPRIAGADLVFTTTGTTPISGFSRAKRALDEKMLTLLHGQSSSIAETSKLQPWRLHDIRRTVASGMARLGLDIAVIEKVLNHTSGSLAGIVGVYQRYEFAQEKERALKVWGSFVASLVEDKPASNVVPLVQLNA